MKGILAPQSFHLFKVLLSLPTDKDYGSLGPLGDEGCSFEMD